MRLGRRWVLGTALVASTLASSARPSSLRIERVAATSQGFLYVEFELESLFEGVFEDALHSGLPARLNYTIELWRQRAGWWDKLEGTEERRFRIFRDLLNDLYYVFYDRTRDTYRFSHEDSLTAFVSRGALGSPQGPQYFSKNLFEPGKHYYVVVTATLAPLTVEDLKELDVWLRGTLTGRGDAAGGISGITRTMGGMLIGMTGFGDKQIKARTPSFTPEDVPREPPLPPAESRPPERRLAAPDSGHSP